MARIVQLSEADEFPPSGKALDYPNGLLAAGGDLSPQRLLSAYRRGIFPWYDDPQPILWWTPDPRSVLFPEDLHISRSLRKVLRRNRLRLAVDTRFREVMHHCAELRGDGLGTWIGEDMVGAYSRLHEMGYAHSVEVLDQQNQLVGGLYGVALGKAYFGESMFSRIPDASKVALVALVDILQRGGVKVIDCQVESDHLNSMGAQNISRLDFEALLAQTVNLESEQCIWQLPATCGDLL